MTLRQILVYSDSLSWGIIPGSRRRLEFDQRWPGVFEHQLNMRGIRSRIFEDCLNGRRTVLDDPAKPGRNGLEGLGQKIEMHSPLALVILMLGTNDFQNCHSFEAQDSADGVSRLIGTIRHAPLEPGMISPPILVVCPPLVVGAKDNMAEKFAGSGAKCVGLENAYQAIAFANNCYFFNAGDVIGTSQIDGVHIDADAHQVLGAALAEFIQSRIAKPVTAETA